MSSEGEVPSIRRESFIESYVIQEEDGEDCKGRLSSRAQSRESLLIDDIEDIEIDAKNGSQGDSMGVSLLGSFAKDMDIDTSHGSSLQPTTYIKKDSTASSPSASGDSMSSAPNFAGGSARRKGDRQRRARQRFGASNESRRASAGAMERSQQQSFMESFGDMSLASFTSLNSFTSSVNANGGKNVEVGNLVFVSDAEMAEIMYGGSDNVDNTNDGKSVSDNASTASNISSSLPPSAMLGTGAFSTVRLAWRKTPDFLLNDNKKPLPGSIGIEPSTSYQEDGHDGRTGRGERRSIVRVESNHPNENDEGGDDNNLTKGELVAVKIIQKSILKQMKTIQKGSNNRLTVCTAFDNIEREIATMKRLKHPNLVRLFEVIGSIESDRLHMVLEYVSLGEILSHVEGTNRYKRMRYRRKVKGLTEAGHFDEKHSAMYFVDIMHGLAYLHRNRICHRDLKPENILLCASGIAKISDFGVAHIFEDEKARESYMVSQLDDDEVDGLLSDVDDSERQGSEVGVSPTHLTKRESDVAFNMPSRHDRGMLKKTEGTWCFWSPEMCSIENKQGFSGYSSDLWAAGICLYIFTTGMLPFFSLVPSELFELIAEAEVQYEGLGLSMSRELKDLLGKLLNKNPSKRAGVGDCLKHDFCANARIKRLDELGSKFKDSEHHIILSKNDVDMALSITMPTKHHSNRTISKRYSAPEAGLLSTDDCDTPTNLAASPSSNAKGDGSNLTTLTEASVDAKDPADSAHSSAPCSPASNKKKPKKRSLVAKLKRNIKLLFRESRHINH